MSIMAVRDQSDVRGSTRLLADTVKRYIDEVPADSRHVPAMNGMFRLLKAYRTQELRSYEYEPRPERGSDAMSMLPSGNRRIGDLRVAIEEAISDVGQGREALTIVEHVLRVAVSPDGHIDDAERATASRFLGSLVSHLRAVA
jgi:hypothetical protein